MSGRVRPGIDRTGIDTHASSWSNPSEVSRDRRRGRCPIGSASARQGTVALPSTPLTFGFFTARFDPSGTFTLEGEGWPPFKGTWKVEAAFVLSTPDVRNCAGEGRYRLAVDNGLVHFDVESDGCQPRRMIVDRSTWRPAGTVEPIAARHIARTGADRVGRCRPRRARRGAGRRFAARTRRASNGAMHLPDRWNGASGENMLLAHGVPGLGHSSPIVWGQRIFVTSAVSSRGKATFKPGLYGDGDASDDRSPQRWTMYAVDKKTGKVLWERVAYEGTPSRHASHEVHLRECDAGHRRPAGHRVVRIAGRARLRRRRQLPVEGRSRADESRRVRHSDLRVGPGELADPVERPRDPAGRHAGRLVRHRAQRRHRRDGVEDRSRRAAVVGHADGGDDAGRPRARDQRVEVRARLRSADRQGAVAHRRQLEDHGADADLRRRPLHRRQRPRARAADLRHQTRRARRSRRCKNGETSSAQIAWSRTGRGSYMPTPLVHDGILYVLANNGVFDAYDVATGEEIYRQRLEPVGSGFSASPVVADGKIYLSSEDGEMLVVAAGRTFKQIATNSMGDLLMATPALSDGVMYVARRRACSRSGASE